MKIFLPSFPINILFLLQQRPSFELRG